MDWKVVFAGMASVKVRVLAVPGPLFVTVCVYVMFDPAVTLLAFGTFVIARSA
jgi:hypothetical protein